MNPKQIKEVLQGETANKRLGQHFLIDKSALNTIVEAAGIEKGDKVLEIGPGLGVLSLALKDAGAQIVAIERDRRFIPRLIESGIEVHQGDAAKMDWSGLVGGGQWKFVSNLPYSITSLALRKALYGQAVPDIVVVLVQREVAERALARDGKQSLLSLMIALSSYESQIMRRVPPGAFYPPPKVESAILKIRPMTKDQRLETWGIEPEEVMTLAKKGFAHPRKLLSGNLGIPLPKWNLLAGEIGIPEKVRAEDLTVDQWVELAKSI